MTSPTAYTPSAVVRLASSTYSAATGWYFVKSLMPKCIRIACTASVDSKLNIRRRLTQSDVGLTFADVIRFTR
eukprot:906237-Pleurochrysis_carterae.AAC.4